MDFTAIDAIRKVTINYQKKSKRIIFQTTNVSNVRLIVKAGYFANFVPLVAMTGCG